VGVLHIGRNQIFNEARGFPIPRGQSSVPDASIDGNANFRFRTPLGASSTRTWTPMLRFLIFLVAHALEYSMTFFKVKEKTWQTH